MDDENIYFTSPAKNSDKKLIFWGLNYKDNKLSVLNYIYDDRYYVKNKTRVDYLYITTGNEFLNFKSSTTDLAYYDSYYRNNNSLFQNKNKTTLLNRVFINDNNFIFINNNHVVTEILETDLICKFIFYKKNRPKILCDNINNPDNYKLLNGSDNLFNIAILKIKTNKKLDELKQYIILEYNIQLYNILDQLKKDQLKKEINKSNEYYDFGNDSSNEEKKH